MTKTKIAGLIAGAAAIAGSIAIIAAQAQTAQLSVGCTGSVSNNVVTWNAAASGGNAPYSYVWTGDLVGGSTSSAVMATYASNGTRTVGVQVTDASSTVATSTCSATVSSFTTNPSSTVPLPKANPPMLQIGPAGNFLARGMTVTSVSSGSFQGQVWGITYTVNFSRVEGDEFLFRTGNMSTSTPTQQLNVGDEVGVSGKVDPSAPLVVNANVVRDYSIVKPRVIEHIENISNGGDHNNQGKGEGDHGSSVAGGGDNQSGTTSGTNDGFNRLQGLLQELQHLQQMFQQQHGGDKGQGGQSSNQGNGNGY